MSGAFVGTVAFAASAGVTTFFAPCAFPLLPGYVGYYVQHAERERTGLLSASVAAVGALAALGVVAALAFALGRALTTLLPLFEPFVGLVLIAFGLLALSDRDRVANVSLPRRPESLLGFGLFGAMYALAAAGCVAPLFLGVVTQALTFAPLRGLVVVVAYAAAVALPLVGVTLLASAGVESWRSLGRYTGAIERLAAVAIVVAGLWQLYRSLVLFGVV